MSKKTWLKVKRGLLDPKHQQKMGVRVWLYLYILDIADWETGTATGWTDKECSDDLGIPKSTVRKQRQKLEADGYITSVREFQSSKITIHNYTNPRKYDGEIINPKGHTVQEWTPPPVKNDAENPHTVHYSVQQSAIEMDTPPLDSQITDSQVIKDSVFLYLFKMFDDDILLGKEKVMRPVDFISIAWNEIIGKRGARKLNATRIKKCATRWKSEYWRSNYQAALTKASKSNHLMSSNWFDFDYFIRDDLKIEKILQGKFDSFDEQVSNGRAPSPPSSADIFDAARKRHGVEVD